MDLLKRDDLPPSQEEDLASERAKAAVKDFVTKTRQGLLAETRLQGAMTLAQFVNNSYGIEAAMLGKHLRQQRAIAFVLQLLYEGEVKLQRIGLMLVSNLCSDAFDPKSAETKRQVQHASVFERIKDFVYSPDTVAQVYALACLQNLSKDVAFARLIRDYEVRAPCVVFPRDALRAPHPDTLPAQCKSPGWQRWCRCCPALSKCWK